MQTETSFEPTQQKIKATLANYITFNWQWALKWNWDAIHFVGG